MLLLYRINLTYFVTAFAVCLLVIYTFTPPPQVVVKFPSPYNAGKVTYRDTSNTCFKYRAEKESCPTDKSKLREQPITEDFNNPSLRPPLRSARRRNNIRRLDDSGEIGRRL
jgi:hypothetical protein